MPKSMVGVVSVRVIQILLFLLLVYTASSETVFININYKPLDSPLPSEKLIQQTVDSALAVEDGVMDSLFNHGHIIFNAGFDNDTDFLSTTAFKQMNRTMAKSNGASYFICLEILYRQGNSQGNDGQGNTDQTPEGVQYSFFTVDAETPLTSGDLYPAGPGDKEQEDSAVIWFALGQEIAIKILEFL